MSWEINAARRSWFIAVSNEWHDKIFKKLFPLLEKFIISTASQVVSSRARIKQKGLNGDSWNSCRCATCGSSARRPRKGQGWPLAGGTAAAAPRHMGSLNLIKLNEKESWRGERCCCSHTQLSLSLASAACIYTRASLHTSFSCTQGTTKIRTMTKLQLFCSDWLFISCNIIFCNTKWD